MSLISESDRREISAILSKELGPIRVRIINFTDSNNCEYCNDTNQLLKELSEISNGRIVLETYNIRDEAAAKYDVKLVPATILTNDGTENHNVRYYGIPAGYEFMSLLDDIIDLSRGRTRLSPQISGKVREISKQVRIKVFVTPTCPYCPRAVRIAHQFAIENKNIIAEMIESIEFPELSERYSVMAVPKIVINDKVEFEGAVPENVFLWKVMEALN